MSIFDRFKGKKKPGISMKLGVSEYSIDKDAGTYTIKEYDSFEEYRAHLEEIVEKAKAAAPPPHKRPCDVFLCHNSEDKQTVLSIGEKLKARGIVPWIDSERIVGGSRYDDVIQKAMIETRSAAIFIGSAGIGNTQVDEVRGFLYLDRKGIVRAIPVLLPECDSMPKEEVFLQIRDYVNFSSIDDQSALEELISDIKSR